ncbi:unnamed protein product [Rhizophagus irregularis]|nr:unnamed protein product [Rhizophagus irregularis]
MSPGWRFIYNEIKDRIWIPRCEEVKRLEEKANITKTDLKKRKNKPIETSETDETGDEDDRRKNNKKKIKTKNLEKENKNKLRKKLV